MTGDMEKYNKRDVLGETEGEKHAEQEPGEGYVEGVREEFYPETQEEDLQQETHRELLEEESQEEPPPRRPGFLELVYGVLFEPVKTFKKVALFNPLREAVLIFFLVNLLAGVMGAFINSLTFSTSMQVPAFLAGIIKGMLPLFIIGGLIFQFVKWLVYSGFLHLLADFFGGTGRARGVFAVYGLASLPGIFSIPFQLLVLGLSPGSFVSNVILMPVSIALYIWGVILLVIGIREVHGFTTGRSAAVVFTPAAAMIVAGILAVVVIIGIAASLPQNIPGMPFRI